MQKFVPYAKLSKKAKKQADARRRGNWGGMNPITRKPAPPKAYNRAKERRASKDLSSFPLSESQAFIFERRLKIMDNAHWNPTLVSLVEYIRSTMKMYYYKSFVYDYADNQAWWSEFQEFYNSIPVEVFHNAGITKCNHNFEAIVSSEIIGEDVRNAELNELERLESPLYPYRN